MADERFGGMLGMMQGNNRPYGGENPALQGLLGMMERLGPQPVFSTTNGSAAVENMLSTGNPSRRFKVYSRKLGTDEQGNAQKSSGSFAHWLFISDDGKEGFGFNQEGEEIELPKSLDGYKLHPDFADRSFSASGLKKARQARVQGIADRYQYAEDNPWLFYDSGEMPDIYSYDGPRNNCQHYIKDIVKYYQE